MIHDGSAGHEGTGIGGSLGLVPGPALAERRTRSLGAHGGRGPRPGTTAGHGSVTAQGVDGWPRPGKAASECGG